jgi:hypothetical protein
MSAVFATVVHLVKTEFFFDRLCEKSSYGNKSDTNRSVSGRNTACKCVDLFCPQFLIAAVGTA